MVGFKEGADIEYVDTAIDYSYDYMLLREHIILGERDARAHMHARTHTHVYAYTPVFPENLEVLVDFVLCTGKYGL